jgi:long-chain acyl-CoA synthetase
VQGHRNLADVIRDNSQKVQNGHGVASRPALIWQRQSITWPELDALVDRYAAGLRALDLRDGSGYPARVAIALPNRPELAALYFGILRADLIAVPINPGYTGRELVGVLADSGASVLVGTGEALASVASLADARLPALRHRYRLGHAIAVADGAAPLDSLPIDGAPPVDASSGGEDVALLLYTSGTDGAPKGAMLSHRALLTNHEQLAAIEPPPIGPDDTVLLAVPLFHAYGLNSGLGGVAYHGATGVLVETFDPAESVRLIAAHQVTAVLGVPTMFLAWSLLTAEAADRPGIGDGFASVRVAVSGAAPLAATTARRFLEITRHPILVGYGLTESAPVLTTTLASPVPKDGSIGRAIPGVDVKLVGADGEEVWHSSADAPPIDLDDFDDDASGSPGTDPGEIVVRGANLFSGYWPDGRDGPDANGWWATGDVAYADADGDLFLVDRLRELILVNGFNVYPLEVENVLVAHPAVVAAAVLGVPHPYTGQTVKAYVVTSAPVGADELMAHCERNLARYKCPSAIEFTAELPRSATGKVRKVALRNDEA